MTPEEIYKEILGHEPNKEFGVQGRFTWNDIKSMIELAQQVKKRLERNQRRTNKN